MTTVRTKSMIDSAPDYYQYSRVFEQIQAAQADEYDSQEAKDLDLQRQLYIPTATWALKYWEAGLKIATNEADNYEIRRSRVLSKRRSPGNFSASLVKSVCEAFINGEVDVTINVAAQEVIIQFIGVLGIPPNIGDLFATVDNIAHAHLGVVYRYRYITVGKVSTLTIGQLQSNKLSNFSPFREIV